MPDVVSRIADPVVVEVVTSTAYDKVVAAAKATYNPVPVDAPVGVIATNADAPVPVNVPDPFTINALFARRELSVIENTSVVAVEVIATLRSFILIPPAVIVMAFVPTADPVIVIAPFSAILNTVSVFVSS